MMNFFKKEHILFATEIIKELVSFTYIRLQLIIHLLSIAYVFFILYGKKKSRLHNYFTDSTTFNKSTHHVGIVDS